MTVQHVTVCSLAVSPKWSNSNIVDLIPSGKFRQSDHPYILYWSAWQDPWLSGYDYCYLPKTNPVIKPRWITEEIGLIRPSEATIENIKSALRKKHQYLEQRWLLMRILEALQSYDNLRMKRIVVIKREVVGGVLSDDELLKLIRNWQTTAKAQGV
jgi:hypothetical protein